MNKLVLFFALVVGMASSLCAQDAKAPAQELTAAETKFKELMSNVTMNGRWYPLKDEALGEQKEDQYVITGVAKVKGDSWIINTKMKYGEREITMPFPVEIKWAGDTPVIIVDKMTVPGGGTYSARVLFFEKTYAGSWTGAKGGGGLLSGVITKNKE